MGINYVRAPDIEARVRRVLPALEMAPFEGRIVCMRSFGSRARRTLARCHALPRIMQSALGVQAHYVIEIVSEHFDRLSPADQLRVIIHELLHIPRSFGGGLKGHRYVNRRRIEVLFDRVMRDEG